MVDPFGRIGRLSHGLRQADHEGDGGRDGRGRLRDDAKSPAMARGEIILYSTEDGRAEIQLRAEEGTAWLTQAQMAELFDTTKQNVRLHMRNVLAEGEVGQSGVKQSLIPATDGKRYRTKIYNLDAILAVGYRVRSPRGVQFRRWATTVLREYLVKGFAMNDERLKDPDRVRGGPRRVFQTSTQAITQILGSIFRNEELSQEATCKESLQVRAEGSRRVCRKIRIYNVDAILAVGYRVRSPRGAQSNTPLRPTTRPPSSPPRWSRSQGAADLSVL